MIANADIIDTLVARQDDDHDNWMLDCLHAGMSWAMSYRRPVPRGRNSLSSTALLIEDGDLPSRREPWG